MPTQETVQRAIAEIRKRRANYEYFFDQLNDPSWIIPLKQASPPFFAEPPDIERVGEYIRVPVWPESRYLARMASRSPQDVQRVLLDLPRTENARVHEDIVEAACGMPADLAAPLASGEARWLRDSGTRLLIGDPYGKLLSHLAEGGQVGIALELASALLSFAPDSDSSIRHGDRAVPAKLSPFEYQELLTAPLAALACADGSATLQLITTLLSEVIELERTSGSEPNDLSEIWRPAVEDHEQNLDTTIREYLVSAVRDVAESLGRAGAEQLAMVLDHLTAQQWRIFDRIALHLARVLVDVDVNHSERLARSKARFDQYQHEYVLLLQQTFRRFSPVAAEEILSWIEAGPSVEYLDISGSDDEEPTGQAAAQRRIQLWRRNRLAAIAADLPPRWRAEYDQLVQRWGNPDHPEFPHFYASRFVGSRSPSSAEDLRPLSDDDLVSFLRDWAPIESGFDAPTRTGLADAFSEALRADPQRIPRLAIKMKGLAPVYVRSLFSAARHAAEREVAISWKPLLELAEWVLSQPDVEVEANAVRSWEHGETGWRWTKSEILSVMEYALREGKAEAGETCQPAIWRIISTLLQDDEPLSDTGAEEADSSVDSSETGSPLNKSINTVRGKALHAVFNYAFWRLRRADLCTLPVGATSYQCFQRFPEVQRALEDRLNPEMEHSAAIRSVYGQWFPQIVLLDNNWASLWKDRIFSSQPASGLGGVAWETYLVMNRVYSSVFDMLEPQYEWSAQNIALLPRRRVISGGTTAVSALGVHLVTLFLWGRLGDDPAQSLVGRFIAGADPDSRRDVLSATGSMLESTSGTVPQQAVRRLIALWHHWTRALRSSSGSPNRFAELAPFGTWFSSGVFEESWSLTELKYVLRWAHAVDDISDVMDRLTKVSDTHIQDAIEVVDAFIDAYRDHWEISHVREHIKVVLRRALSDVRLAYNASRVVNKLGVLGYRDFRDLVPSA